MVQLHITTKHQGVNVIDYGHGRAAIEAAQAEQARLEGNRDVISTKVTGLLDY